MFLIESAVSFDYFFTISPLNFNFIRHGALSFCQLDIALTATLPTLLFLPHFNCGLIVV